MSRVIPTMDEIIDKSFVELKETVNALRITYAPNITKTQLQKCLFKDVKDEQFERERQVFAKKQELLKLEADAMENNFRLERFKAAATEINHRRELEILEARRALLSEGHEHRNELKVYQVIRMFPKWIESNIETFLTTFEKLATTNDWPRDKYLAIIQTQMSPKALKYLMSFPQTLRMRKQKKSYYWLIMSFLKLIGNNFVHKRNLTIKRLVNMLSTLTLCLSDGLWA